MKNKSVFPFVAVVGGLIAFGLYTLFHAFPTMPIQASVQAESVDGAWNGLLIVETTIYALVMSFLLYCLIFFRAVKREEQGEKFSSSRGPSTKPSRIGAGWNPIFSRPYPATPSASASATVNRSLVVL